MAGGRAGERIYGVGNAVQGSVGPDRDICTGHIIVNGAYQSHDGKLWMLLGMVRADSAGFDEFVDEARPFRT